MKRSMWALVLGVVAAALLFLGSVSAEEPRRWIELDEGVRVWRTEEQIQRLINDKIHFMDEDIDALLKELSAEEIAKTITNLSQLYTRYYTSTTGVEGAKLLHSWYSEFGRNQSHVSVRFFDHTWAQPSVIARIEGTGENADELVIIGGHEDSVGYSSTGRAPGADDDASGSSSVLEVFRVLAKNGFRGSRSIEFHAYAAEEVGLRGSQAIASTYQKEGKVVAGMMQLDMVGYVAKGNPVYAIVTDYVSAPLTQFVRDLAKEYSSLPVVDTRCGYACSDHASWTKAGYPSTFPFETAFNQDNPSIHSPADTLDKISPEHAREFAKVALAFAVELSTQ
ncbi:peptidase, M20/M25/M40 superfamily protein [Acanthamoeba castellanii str. Neff]|uniref:Peptidase, M20/M25/M40 superfamily protein n=1 Tax=Acanthamoeba castellanii (strain ATCC 30010 / Neff) TaxID=1257118 RepID=L8H1H1_ACACF|nr:peptidase, M20/M25/M40 superfamily protein [Acanthamoeba castellanii str. Neff]ELR19067.1 peptidase, M20/M25/M40 superfamily protein [Acanthamoeba castellanii str. Neff]